MSFSQHAEKRCAQRNISRNDVLYVLQHGRRYWNAGTLMYFLGRRDIPAHDRADQRVRQLVGLCVHTRLVETDTLLIVTLYHNEKTGLKDHRRKQKFDRRNYAA